MLGHDMRHRFFFSANVYVLLSIMFGLVLTDPKCMQLCEGHGYPCFDYQHPYPRTHVMEQVAELKILQVQRALEAGVHIMLLDLDVGFLRDPALLYEG